MTVKQMAIELNIGFSSVGQAVRRARAHGTTYLRIADWVGGRPRYAPGPGEDCTEGGTVSERILAHLTDAGPSTITELAAALPANVSSVQRAIEKLREGRGNLHITSWKLNRGISGREAPIFRVGAGSDVPRPDFSLKDAEAARRYGERRRIRRAVRRHKHRLES